MLETRQKHGYDLLPKLRTLRVPTLVIYGYHDFIPVEIAQHIAQSLPNAQLVTLKNCDHFAYPECAADVRSALNELFQS